MFNASDSWISTYPGACIGLLQLRGVSNPGRHPELEARKRQVEADLRARFGGMDRAALKAHPTLAAYAAFYKQFKKTYHVQLQLESIVFKEKSIPSVAALVEIMFMEELKNLLLTAGHDREAVMGIPSVDVATGLESYVRMDGQEQTLKAGDMFIKDDASVLSSVVYGPDRRTRLTPDTTHALYTAYGPPGIGVEQMEAHLEDLASSVFLVSPLAEVEALQVIATT